MFELHTQRNCKALPEPDGQSVLCQKLVTLLYALRNCTVLRSICEAEFTDRFGEEGPTNLTATQDAWDAIVERLRKASKGDDVQSRRKVERMTQSRGEDISDFQARLEAGNKHLEVEDRLSARALQEVFTEGLWSQAAVRGARAHVLLHGRKKVTLQSTAEAARIYREEARRCTVDRTDSDLDRASCSEEEEEEEVHRRSTLSRRAHKSATPKAGPAPGVTGQPPSQADKERQTEALMADLALKVQRTQESVVEMSKLQLDRQAENMQQLMAFVAQISIAGGSTIGPSASMAPGRYSMLQVPHGQSNSQGGHQGYGSRQEWAPNRTPEQGRGHNPGASRDLSQFRCYACQEMGHRAFECTRSTQGGSASGQAVRTGTYPK